MEKKTWLIIFYNNKCNYVVIKVINLKLFLK
jgi:hypothetical protein